MINSLERYLTRLSLIMGKTIVSVGYHFTLTREQMGYITGVAQRAIDKEDDYDAPLTDTYACVWYSSTCYHGPRDCCKTQSDLRAWFVKTPTVNAYLHDPSKSSLSRLSAYINGTQDNFLDQPAEIIICQACGNRCYYIRSLDVTPVCSVCHKDATILQDISVWAIPVYIDIDGFYWEEPDMPDPDTYADACAMYGW